MQSPCVGVDELDELVRLGEHRPPLLLALVGGGLQLLLNVRDHLALQHLQLPLHLLQRLGLQALRLVDGLHLALPARKREVK